MFLKLKERDYRVEFGGRKDSGMTDSEVSSWMTSWKRDMQDPPSVQLCCFGVLGTLSFQSCLLNKPHILC